MPIVASSRLVGFRFWNAFRFCGEDYIFGTHQCSPQDIKQAVVDYVVKKGITSPVSRVEIVAHLRTFGYSFNPAAFYYCYDALDQVVCAVVEVTNTYREKKSYFIPYNFQTQTLEQNESKYFYVSPFVDLDSEFQFCLKVPKENLFVEIHSIKNGSCLITSQVQGRSVLLDDWNLMKALLQFPLVTLGVITKIHYQAFRLFLMGLPFIRKEESPHLQKKGQ